MQYRLSDETISSIAKLVQLAILTGTDVVDNLRTLRLEASDEELIPTAEFNESFQSNLDDLAQKALDLQNDFN
jgi:hypothetical protein